MATGPDDGGCRIESTLRDSMRTCKLKELQSARVRTSMQDRSQNSSFKEDSGLSTITKTLQNCLSHTDFAVR